MEDLPWEFLDAAPDAMLIASPQDVVRFANQRAADMFEAEATELRGGSVNRLIDRQGVTALPPASAFDHEDFNARIKVAGEYVPVRVYLRRVMVATTAWRLLVIRRAEQFGSALPRLTNSWRQMAIAEIGHALAHELNQPLAAIALHCDAATSTARANPELAADLNTDLDEAATQAFRASEVVRTMRRFFHNDSADTAFADANALVREASEQAAPTLTAADIAVNLDLADNLPDLYAQAPRLAQALYSLLHICATKIADSEGASRRLSISTTLKDDGRILIMLTSPDLYMTPHDVEFRPLGGGKSDWIGLEFAICRRVVLAHAGNLKLSSKSANGQSNGISLELPGDRSKPDD